MATTTPTKPIDPSLPIDVQQQLQELELELAEGMVLIYVFAFSPETFSPGDITQKGFEKKRAKLLAPYQQRLSK